MSARYHFLLRSLEGAFIRFDPQPQISLFRNQDPECASFEVALCRECGEHYLVGRINGDRFDEAIRDPADERFGADFLRPVDADMDDADSEGPDRKSRPPETRRYLLCGRCGAVWSQSASPGCSHNQPILVEQQPAAGEREDQIPRCTACGYQAPDPVREVVHGTNGPHAVIATTLHQQLPPDRRKVLAFADSRQEAAFFAGYLGRTYNDIVTRSLLLQVVRKHGLAVNDGLSPREVATRLRDLLRQHELVKSAAGDLEALREAWLRVLREFLTDEQRISLEGVGLIRWRAILPPWVNVPQVLRLPPWSLSDLEARDLLSILLDSMRRDRGVELPSDVPISWGDLELQAAQMRFCIGPPGKQKNLRSWDGRMTNRTALLAKLLGKLGHDEAAGTSNAIATLRAAWDAIDGDEAGRSDRDRLLVPVDSARRLNSDWWRVQRVGPKDTIYQCDTCARLQMVSVRNVCPRGKCHGALRPTRLVDLEENHYRSLYQQQLPGTLRV